MSDCKEPRWTQLTDMQKAIIAHLKTVVNDKISDHFFDDVNSDDWVVKAQASLTFLVSVQVIAHTPDKIPLLQSLIIHLIERHGLPKPIVLVDRIDENAVAVSAMINIWRLHPEYIDISAINSEKQSALDRILSMLQDNYRRKHHFTVFNELVQISNSSILNRAARNIGAPLIANAVLFAGEGEFSDELTDDDVLQPFRSLLKRAEDDGSGVCLGVMQPSRGAPDLLQWVGKTVHEWIGHLKATKAQIAPYYDIAMNRLNLMDHELAVVTNRQLRYRTTLAPMVSDVWTQSCKIPKRIASNITPIIAAYLLHSTEFQYTESE